MSAESLASFVDALIINRLLPQEQLNKVTQELLPRIRDSRALAKDLVQRGWLTIYQVNQILQGMAKDLILGPYRILDLLGEGAVAQVFRAWHSVKRVVVALKVVRKEFLSNPDAIRQFEQESRVIASLSHPNIIETFDPEQVAGMHFLAMEYIEGIDLAKLVRLSGPLPFPHACDYARQTCLALQYAHEHCLVHRDIKPANLFLVTPPELGLDVTPGPDSDPRKPPPLGTLIKVLDWGLAEIRKPLALGEQEPANTLQREETIGTADYMAPEQAMDASSVDIRSDIYSLGCVLYFLLAGRPPFPGGSLMQKLLKHRESAPLHILELRPDIYQGLPPILDRMMAKNPNDRYRTPASVAAALKSFCVALPMSALEKANEILSSGSATLIRRPTR